MYLRVPKFLNDQNLKLVDELIASSQFIDGMATTGGPTIAAKKNLQIDFAARSVPADDINYAEFESYAPCGNPASPYDTTSTK